MRTQATAKFVGTSARKVNLVAALIRGRKATDAQVVLANTAKRATDPVGEVLKSAIANAENNFNAKKAELVVESVFVGPGPTLKRFRPRARGAAGSIRKRTSHITVILSDQKTDKPVDKVIKSKSVAAPAKNQPKVATDSQSKTNTESGAE